MKYETLPLENATYILNNDNYWEDSRIIWDNNYIAVLYYKLPKDDVYVESINPHIVIPSSIPFYSIYTKTRFDVVSENNYKTITKNDLPDEAFWNARESITDTQEGIRYLSISQSFPPSFKLNSQNQLYVRVLIKSTNPIQYITEKTGYVGFYTDYNIPTVKLTYPTDVITSRNQKLIFNWEFNERYVTKQKMYEIEWTSDNWSTSHSVSNLNANNYHEFAANTFPAGHINYRVRVTNNDDQVSEWAYAEFDVTGESEAPFPKLISSDDPFTVFIWYVQNQRAFECQLVSTDKTTLYATSGVVMEEDEDGEGYYRFRDYYIPEGQVTIVRVRYLNKYGYWSKWGELSFRLNYPRSELPTDLTVVKYGTSVSINCTPNDNALKTFIDRNGELIANYEGNTIYDFPPLNTDIVYKTYTYTNSRLMYKGEDVTSRIDFDGIVLHDIANPVKYVAIDKANEELQFIQSDTTNYELKRLLGKEYPVREQNNWKNSTRTFNCHLYDSEYEQMKVFANSKEGVLYRGTNERWYASVDMVDNGAYVGGGRNVSITLTRIYKDERREWA